MLYLTKPMRVRLDADDVSAPFLGRRVWPTNRPTDIIEVECDKALDEVERLRSAMRNLLDFSEEPPKTYREDYFRRERLAWAQARKLLEGE